MKRFAGALIALAAACGGPSSSPADPRIAIVPPQPPQPAPPVPSATPAPPPPAVLPVATTTPFRCDAGKRFEVGARSYCAHPEPESWEASERRCIAEGGHLMSLDESGTNDAVHRALGSPVNAGRAAWIGLELKTNAGKRVWTWTSGEAVTATSWNTGEPNDFDGHEACGEWLVVDGRWNDTRCNLKQPYLCQAKPDKNLVCRGNQTFAFEGASWCLNVGERTFADAKRACAADGGALAVVRTTQENNALRTAFAQRFAAKRMWIGLTDDGEEGNWRWLSGAPMTFSAWQPNEPNDFNGEDCGELHADTWSWNDLDCNVALPSVCESPLRRK